MDSPDHPVDSASPGLTPEDTVQPVDSTTALDWPAHFSRFRAALEEREPGLLHFAAHSHHWWPDVTADAHARVWSDAARWVDEKWSAQVFAEVIPSLQSEIAQVLDLPDPQTLAFAPNTHEFVLRLFSCLEPPTARPVRILSTDGEFHSFRRQTQRWEEAGLARVERVATDPFDSFDERWLDAVQRSATDGVDLVFLSQVFFDSGLVAEELAATAAMLPEDTLFVVDGYHGFMALPTAWATLADRVFYLSGGYKYAMAGEGACFLHCPPGLGERPVNTGWYAAFGALQDPPRPDAVPYARDGNRFFGATFDPSGLYRLESVLAHWRELGVTVGDLHARVMALQERFLDGLRRAPGLLSTDDLLPLPEPRSSPDGGLRRAHFLTFRRDDAQELQRRLRELGVLTDVRGDRLRFGFGVYQTEADIDTLLGRLEGARPG